MAKIQLKTNVKLDITENGKTIKSFAVSYRELSKKQQRSMGKDNKEILDIFRQGQAMDRRIETTASKIEAYKELGQSKDLLVAVKKLDKLYDDRDDLEDRFEDLGGLEKMMEASKITFDQSVSGEDLEDLVVWIEDNSDYGTVLSAIAEDAKSQKGKL